MTEIHELPPTKIIIPSKSVTIWFRTIELGFQAAALHHLSQFKLSPLSAIKTPHEDTIDLVSPCTPLIK